MCLFLVHLMFFHLALCGVREKFRGTGLSILHLTHPNGKDRINLVIF